MLQRLAIFCSAVGLVIMAACAQTDPGITTAVKTKLAADATVKASQINVDTTNGVVTLTGTVDAPAAKEQAVVLARGTDGVKDVVDRITVSAAAATAEHVGDHAASDVNDATRTAGEKIDSGATATKNAAERGADATRNGVERGADATKNGVERGADATNNGVERGAEATKNGVERGAEATKNGVERGATATKNGIERGVEATKNAVRKGADATSDAAHDVGDKSKAAGEKSGEFITDAAITTAVKTKLLGDSKTPGLKINVDTNDGVVTLSGTVPTQAEETKAVADARATKGVKRVVNKLKVGG